MSYAVYDFLTVVNHWKLETAPYDEVVYRDEIFAPKVVLKLKGFIFSRAAEGDS